jgi:hypothetical protein
MNNLSGSNTTDAPNSFIAAGTNNSIQANAKYGIIMGGTGNQIQNYIIPPPSGASPLYNLIGTGNNNIITHSANNSVILSGQFNNVSDEYSAILSGSHNTIQAPAGNPNTYSYNSITSGSGNTIGTNSQYAAILGGSNNSVSDNFSVILNGTSNVIEAPTNPTSYNLISNGFNNRIKLNASYSSIIGGYNNIINAGVSGSVILGGANITATQSNTVYVPKIAFPDGSIQTSAATSTYLYDSLVATKYISTPVITSPYSYIKILNKDLYGIRNISSQTVGTGTLYVGDSAQFKGLAKYAADYSAGYTNRSLVDKQYVDDKVASIPPPVPNPWALNPATGNVINMSFGNTGVGVSTPTQKLEVAGMIYSNAGGFKFPDGTIQTTAAGAGNNLWTVGTNSTSITNNLGGINQVLSDHSFIASGQNNYVDVNSSYGIVLGGNGNKITTIGPVSPRYNLIGTGQYNVIDNLAVHSFIASGTNNSVLDSYSAIIGGSNNVIEAPPIVGTSYNFISTGFNNKIKSNAQYSSIIGGYNNTVSNNSVNSMVLTGNNNTISSNVSLGVILGGNFNTIAQNVSGTVILGGTGITATQNNTVYVPKIAFPDGSIQAKAGVAKGDSALFASLRIPNLSDTSGNRIVIADANGNLKTIGGSVPIPIGCTDLFWKTDGNNIPLLCNPFIGTTNARELIFKTNANGVGGGERMRITPSGNVGIGITIPTQKLEIAHDDLNGGLAINRVTALPVSKSEIKFNKNGSQLWAIGNDLNSTGQQDFFIWDHVAQATRLLINQNGNIGIGTITPGANCKVAIETSTTIGLYSKTIQSAPYGYNIVASVNNARTKAFAVIDQNGQDQFFVYGDGLVAAREFKVTLGQFPPDYVFEEKYKNEMLSMKELRAYLNENKHLPGVPSAQEMLKEGAINLGAFQMKQLEKTEELYLYVLQLSDKLEKIEKENKELKTEINELKQK